MAMTVDENTAEIRRFAFCMDVPEGCAGLENWLKMKAQRELERSAGLRDVVIHDIADVRAGRVNRRGMQYVSMVLMVSGTPAPVEESGSCGCGHSCGGGCSCH